MPDFGMLQALANGGSTVLLLAAFWALYTGKFRTRQEIEGLTKEYEGALKRMDERVNQLIASHVTELQLVRSEHEREIQQVRDDLAKRISDMAMDRDFYRSNLIRALSATKGSVGLAEKAADLLERQVGA